MDIHYEKEEVLGFFELLKRGLSLVERKIELDHEYRMKHKDTLLKSFASRMEEDFEYESEEESEEKSEDLTSYWTAASAELDRRRNREFGKKIAERIRRQGIKNSPKAKDEPIPVTKPAYEVDPAYIEQGKNAFTQFTKKWAENLGDSSKPQPNRRELLESLASTYDGRAVIFYLRDYQNKGKGMTYAIAKDVGLDLKTSRLIAMNITQVSSAITHCHNYSTFLQYPDPTVDPKFLEE